MEPLRRGLGEIATESPFLFSWNRGESVKPPWDDINVISVASHPAGARAVLPLVDELANRQAACRLFTPPPKEGIDRAATVFARNFAFTRPPAVENKGVLPEIFSADKTNLIIFGASGGGDEQLELSLIKQAIELKRSGYRTVVTGVEDDASGLVGLTKQIKTAGINLQTEIDALFLANRLPYQSYREIGVPAAKLIPTGPTGFDFLHQENTQELARAFRENNGIAPSDAVIVYNAIRGTGLWSEIEIDATPKILSAVFELAAHYQDRKFVFIYRFHPDDQRPEVLNGILDNRFGQPENLMLTIHQPQETKIDSRSPLAAADLVITTVSTTNTGVALCGAKPESLRPQTGHMPMYFLSEIAKTELCKTGTILPTAAQLGAAAVAQKDDQILSTMEKALFNPAYREEIFSHQATELRNIDRFKGTATATARTIFQIRNLFRH